MMWSEPGESGVLFLALWEVICHLLCEDVSVRLVFIISQREYIAACFWTVCLHSFSPLRSWAFSVTMAGKEREGRGVQLETADRVKHIQKSKGQNGNDYLGFFRLHEWRECKYHVLPKTHKQKSNITVAHFRMQFINKQTEKDKQDWWGTVWYHHGDRTRQPSGTLTSLNHQVGLNRHSLRFHLHAASQKHQMSQGGMSSSRHSASECYNSSSLKRTFALFSSGSSSTEL